MLKSNIENCNIFLIKIQHYDQLQSFISQFLQNTGTSLGAEDEGSFKMRLLHFRRTFVEKMFAIHAKVEAYKKTGIGIGGYTHRSASIKFCKLVPKPSI